MAKATKKPKTSRMVSFRADPDLFMRLEWARVKAERRMADFVRRLVLRGLAAEEAEAKR